MLPSFQRTALGFIDFSIVFYSLYFIDSYSLGYYFLHFPYIKFSLVCSYFSMENGKLRHLFKVFFPLYIEAFTTIHFLLSAAVSASQNFGMLCFCFHSLQDIFQLPLTHWLFRYGAQLPHICKFPKFLSVTDF